MPNVWRVRMQSGKGGIDHAAARRFAIETNVIGAGWGLDTAAQELRLPDHCSDLELYIARAKEAYTVDGDTARLEQAARIFGTEMQSGDYCWIYVTHIGEYWCCKITGAFQYRTGSGFDTYDLHMTRPCQWVRAGTADAVPGVIRRAFAGPFGTVSRLVTDAATAIDAAEVYLGLREPSKNKSFLAVASPDDLEDVAALYLQDQGYRVLPSTAKTSMANYEFIMVQSSGLRAAIQVKSGAVNYLAPVIAEDISEYFVFMANPEAIIDSDDPRIRRISVVDLEQYARKSWPQLPKRLKMLWPLD